MKINSSQEVWALNGKEMTLGHILKSILGRELSALNRIEMTVGHK